MYLLIEYKVTAVCKRIDSVFLNIKMELALEQYLILAKSARGKAAETLVIQCLADPHTFVFGELIDQLKDSELSAPYLHLLEIFAFGTYSIYEEWKSALPELNNNLFKKLKMITLAQLASESSVLEYRVLMKELNISSLRELEDMIIESIYEGLIEGKIDHRLEIFQVQSSYGRDVRPDNIPQLLNKLENYVQHIKNIETLIESQIKRTIDVMESNQRSNEDFQKKYSEQKDLVKLQIQENIENPSSARGPRGPSGIGGLFAGGFQFLNRSYK